jgi:hypothetical protein
MVEKALPLNFHNEFQRIFCGVGKEKPYPEPGLKSAMTRQDRQSRLGVDFRLFAPLVNVIQDSHSFQPWA